MTFFVVSQFLSKHKANTQLTRIYLVNKINPESIVDYVSLPADRQEEIYLQVMHCKGHNITHMILGAARIARDILYIKPLIAPHHHEFAAGTHLSNEAHVRVTPAHTCHPHFAGDATAEAFQCNKRYTVLRQM